MHSMFQIILEFHLQHFSTLVGGRKFMNFKAGNIFSIFFVMKKKSMKPNSRLSLFLNVKCLSRSVVKSHYPQPS